MTRYGAAMCVARCWLVVMSAKFGAKTLATAFAPRSSP